MKEVLVNILKLLEKGEHEIARQELEKLVAKAKESKEIKILSLIFNLPSKIQNNPKLNLLNLGCGYNYHPDWINVDLVKTGEGVLQYNLTKGIPFEDNTFDAIYCSHLLEHFPKRFAPFFLKECFRVLKPSGILRIIVPDLEEIVKLYLENLQLAILGDETAKIRYEWVLLELLDQLTRNHSGGEMLLFWRQYPLPCEDFIYQRVGYEAKKAIKEIRDKGKIITQEEYRKLPPQIINDPVEIGKFRLSGEIHQWMYDRYSLKELLKEVGFEKIEKLDAFTSMIPEFEKYYLDVTPSGEIRKPDSLFMEAVKPQKSEVKEYRLTLSDELEKKQNKALETLNILHLSVWDTGGAGVAALRLHLALMRLGHKSMLLTIYKNTNYPNVFQTERKEFAKNWKWSDYYSIYNSFLKKNYPFRNDDFEFFSSIKSVTILNKNNFLNEADIINFHWVSSLVDFQEDIDIFKNKKIVWTLHDENAYTGGCHYTSGCKKYEQICRACLQLGSSMENDLSYDQFTKKMKFFENTNITIVTPSSWLLENVRKSRLLKHKNSLQILNGIPVGIFHRYNKNLVRKLLKFDNSKIYLLFGADFHSKRKGSYLFKKFLEKCPNKINDKPVEVVIFGNSQEQNLKSNLPINYLGYVEDSLLLAMIYSAADVFVALSLEDNLPNTIVESVCCGTPVVAFDVGGIKDIIEHGKNGWLVKPFSIDEVIEAVFEVSKFGEGKRLEIAHKAQEKFNDFFQAENYLELYNSLLLGNPNENENKYYSLFNFETISNENFVILPFKKLLYNFSGLDLHYFKKIFNFNEISINEFVNLFIIRFLLSYNIINLDNIVLVSHTENFPQVLIPKLFDFSLLLIDTAKIKYKKEIIQNGNKTIIVSPDYLAENTQEFNSNLLIFLLQFELLRTNEVVFLKIFQGFAKSLFNLKMLIFVKLDIEDLEKLQDFLEKLPFEFKVVSIENSLKNSTQSFDSYVTEKNNFKNYTIVTLIVNNINYYLEQIKKINIIKNYQIQLPKISIVTANLNQGKFLETCIKSVINQKYPNLEYIVIDGGSTDNSIDIIKKYEKYLHTWVSEKDEGQYDAINKGFNFATGDILAWINADDFYLPGAFYIIAEFFTSFPNSNWVTTSKITTISVNNEIQTNWGAKEYSLKKILDGNFDKPFIQQESTFWTSKLWKMAGGYLSLKYELASDLELWIRFFEIVNLYLIDLPIAIFRFQTESKTFKSFDKYMQEGRLIIKEKKDALQTILNLNFKGISIHVSISEFIEKSGLKILGKHLEQIINDYKNLSYPPQNYFDQINLNLWIDFLIYLNKVWKQK